MSYGNFVRVKVVTPLAIDTTSFAIEAAVAPNTLPPLGGGMLVLVDSPSNPAFIEVISYGYRTDLALYDVVRGQEGTVARAWSGNTYAFQSLMAGDFQAKLDAKLNITAAQTAFDLRVLQTSATGAAELPKGTTAERPAGVAGQLRYNATLNQFEGYNGTEWGTVGGGARGGGADDVFYENSQTITVDYVLSAGKNAMSAGPISIADGVTVTIPDGAAWSVV